MPRGTTAEEGATRVSDNGYHYTKTDTGWRLTHHLIAEQQIGRALEDTERVIFLDKDRTNLKPSNIRVVKKGTASLRQRLARVQEKMRELRYEESQLIKQINARVPEKPASKAS